MTVRTLPIVARNLLALAWNQTSKRLRHARQRLRRASKTARETGKDVRAKTRGAVAASRDAGKHAYSGAVKTRRFWSRVQERTVPKLRRELAVRRELRTAARGDQPIIAGPWLSEVGYEALYWVPFLRWFVDHFGVDPSRLVIVSRGGTAGWYADLTQRYVELFDLVPPDEFAARNLQRQREGEQKQHGLAGFDAELVARVRALPGLADASLCHPSTMFRLLRQFWLGNESLEYLLEHLIYAPVAPPPLEVADLPERFTAVKFYTGPALPDSDVNRRRLRALVERLASEMPLVLLETRLTIDEHRDYLFDGIADVISLAASVTPEYNLAVQTAVIRRASRFVGTCGGLAWLAPMMGIPTFAVYADDRLLTPHLYAARHAYATMAAAPFTPVDLRATDFLAG